MAAGYGTATPQIVAPNQPIIYIDNTCPCTQGLIFKRAGGGVFLLASNAPSGNNCACGCRKVYLTNYEVETHANIEIPTGGTVEEIRLAIAVDGIIDPESVMSYTPAAVETAGNVGTSIIVPVPSLCGCESVAVINASTQDIQVNNSTVNFDYAGVRRIS